MTATPISISKIAKDAAGGIGKILLTFVAALVLYLFALLIIRETSEIHWVIGAGVTIFYGIGLVIGIQNLASRDARTFPIHKGLAIFFTLVLLGATVFGSLSSLLAKAGWAHYNSDENLTLATFIHYYIWVFLDILPGLKVPQTLGLEPVLKANELIAGLPVVAFRAFVIFGLLKALKIWWSGRDREADCEHRV